MGDRLAQFLQKESGRLGRIQRKLAGVSSVVPERLGLSPPVDDCCHWCAGSSGVDATGSVESRLHETKEEDKEGRGGW